MSDIQQKIMSMIMSALLMLSMLVVGKETAEYVTAMKAMHVTSASVENKLPCVVIDAGHGGS